MIIGVMAPPSGLRFYSRSYDADAALPLRVAQALDPSSTLIKGSQTGAKIGRITTICGQRWEKDTVVSNPFAVLSNISNGLIFSKRKLTSHFGNEFPL